MAHKRVLHEVQKYASRWVVVAKRHGTAGTILPGKFRTKKAAEERKAEWDAAETSRLAKLTEAEAISPAQAAHDTYVGTEVIPFRESKNEVITPLGFAEMMRRISENRDIEARHGDADDLMVKILKSLGYAEGAEIFCNMEAWYA